MTDIKRILSEGIGFEQNQDWESAYAFWGRAAKEMPSEIKFLIRGAAAALRIKKPADTMRLVDKARELDQERLYEEQLNTFILKARKVAASLHRINGMEALKSLDYERARIEFKALDRLEPEHPWANSYLRRASGLAPSFARRLQVSHPSVQDRIFLTGCGRSGTWLLAAMLTAIKNLNMAVGEKPLGEFLWMPNEPEIQLVKREHNAYENFDLVPHYIKILHIVRHPFDVLVSKHLDKEYYISLERMEKEHASMFSHLVERPNTCIVKYENLVNTPDKE